MSIEKTRTSFTDGPPIQKMPRELVGFNSGWLEDVLIMLSGDLSYDNIAKVKQKLRDGLDCQRSIRQDNIFARGCRFAGSGRPHWGNCKDFVGLPGRREIGDGTDSTVDEYGRPNGWCEVCWLSHQLGRVSSELQLTLESYGGKEYADRWLSQVRSKQHIPDSLSCFYLIKAKRLRHAPSGGPVYLKDKISQVSGVWTWTPDINLAIQFSSEVNAEQCAGRHSGTLEIVSIKN